MPDVIQNVPPNQGGYGIWQNFQRNGKNMRGLAKFHSWPKPFNAIARINVLN